MWSLHHCMEKKNLKVLEKVKSKEDGYKYYAKSEVFCEESLKTDKSYPHQEKGERQDIESGMLRGKVMSAECCLARD